MGIKDTLLIVFDPGPHTGIAVFENGNPTQTATHEVDTELPRLQWVRIHQVLSRAEQSGIGRVVIVCEDYHTARYLSLDGVTTIRLTGFIEGLARVYGFDFFLQSPNAKTTYQEAAKRLAFTERLDRHELSAVAHGLAWLARYGDEYGLVRKGA